MRVTFLALGRRLRVSLVVSTPSSGSKVSERKLQQMRATCRCSAATATADLDGGNAYRGSEELSKSLLHAGQAEVVKNPPQQ